MRTLIAAALLLATASPAFASQPAVWNCGPYTYISADKGEVSITTTKSTNPQRFDLRWKGFRVWLNGKPCKYHKHAYDHD